MLRPLLSPSPRSACGALSIRHYGFVDTALRICRYGTTDLSIRHYGFVDTALRICRYGTTDLSIRHYGFVDTALRICRYGTTDLSIRHYGFVDTALRICRYGTTDLPTANKPATVLNIAEQPARRRPNSLTACTDFGDTSLGVSVGGPVRPQITSDLAISRQ